MATRIFVVDDEPFSRDLVADYLGSRGFETIGIESAAALRKQVHQIPPDLILLDVIMPQEDGLSVLRWLRGISVVPVIMLTGEADSADRITGLELGADDCVTKPCDLRELLARCRTRCGAT